MLEAIVIGLPNMISRRVQMNKCWKKRSRWWAFFCVNLSHLISGVMNVVIFLFKEKVWDSAIIKLSAE